MAAFVVGAATVGLGHLMAQGKQGDTFPWEWLQDWSPVIAAALVALVTSWTYLLGTWLKAKKELG